VIEAAAQVGMEDVGVAREPLERWFGQVVELGAALRAPLRQ